jgi:hypothetical protein
MAMVVWAIMAVPQLLRQRPIRALMAMEEESGTATRMLSRAASRGAMAARTAHL